MENKSFQAMASQLNIKSITDRVRNLQAANRYKVLLTKSIAYKWARTWWHKAKTVYNSMLNKKDRARQTFKISIQIASRKTRPLIALAASLAWTRCKPTKVWKQPVSSLGPNLTANSSLATSKATTRMQVARSVAKGASTSSRTSSTWYSPSCKVETLQAWLGSTTRRWLATHPSTSSTLTCRCTRKVCRSRWRVRIRCTTWTRTSRYISSRKVVHLWVDLENPKTANLKEDTRVAEARAVHSRCPLDCQAQQASLLDRWCTRS